MNCNTQGCHQQMHSHIRNKHFSVTTLERFKWLRMKTTRCSTSLYSSLLLLPQHTLEVLLAGFIHIPLIASDTSAGCFVL